LQRDRPVNVRYSPHYRITPEELEWLGERIELLQTFMEQVHEGVIATLKQAARD